VKTLSPHSLSCLAWLGVSSWDWATVSHTGKRAGNCSKNNINNNSHVLVDWLRRRAPTVSRKKSLQKLLQHGHRIIGSEHSPFWGYACCCLSFLSTGAQRSHHERSSSRSVYTRTIQLFTNTHTHSQRHGTQLKPRSHLPHLVPQSQEHFCC
jgi:hypothetical protein